MAGGEPTVRGVVILGIVDWMRANLGREGAQRILEQLPSEDAEWVSGHGVVQTTRVPGRVFRQLGDVLIAAHGLTGRLGYHEAASHVAEADLRGYMKVLLSLGTPSFVVKRFPRVWSHYFDAGRLDVSVVGDEAEVRVEGAGTYGDAALEGALGWMRSALRVSRAAHAHVERTESAPGTGRYAVRWR